MKRFTLIELLVVVAIIGILSSMLLPSLYSVREKSREALCISNQAQLVKAGTIWADDHDGWVPYGHKAINNPDWSKAITWGGNEPLGMGWVVSSKILTNGAAFYCPSNNHFNYKTYEADFKNLTNEVASSQRIYTTYLTNSLIQRFDDSFTPQMHSSWAGQEARIADVSDRAVLMDHVQMGSTSPHPKNFVAAYGDTHVRSFKKSLLEPSITVVDSNAKYWNIWATLDTLE